MPLGNGANVTGSAPRWLRGARGSSWWDHSLGHLSDSGPTPTGTAALPLCQLLAPLPAPQTSVGGQGGCTGTRVQWTGEGRGGLARNRRDQRPVFFGGQAPRPGSAPAPKGMEGGGGNALLTQLNTRQDGSVGKGRGGNGMPSGWLPAAPYPLGISLPPLSTWAAAVGGTGPEQSGQPRALGPGSASPAPSARLPGRERSAHNRRGGRQTVTPQIALLAQGRFRRLGVPRALGLNREGD